MHLSFTHSVAIKKLENDVELLLSYGKINDALCLINRFVEKIFRDSIYGARILASKELDMLCIKIGRQNLSNLRQLKNNSIKKDSSHSKIVYIVSRLQQSGGHSRLLLDFIRAQPGSDHLILSTRVGGRTDDEFIGQLSLISDSVETLFAPIGNLQARLSWLQSILISCGPRHIHLLNHHQDSVAVSAMIPELEIEGSFHHHGDHHLCLGVHLDHINHIDFHPKGYHCCRKVLGISNRYLPFCIEDQPNYSYECRDRKSPLLTSATVARFNKIEVPYHTNYLDVIPEILKATGGRHVHIGKLTPLALRRIRKGMRKHDIPKDRFIYIKWSTNIWKSLNEFGVDIYITSFPFGGGLTLIEVMGAGIPIILHQDASLTFLGGAEMVYPDAFRWSDSKELIKHLENLRLDDLRSESRLSRLRYEKFHKFEILKNYFQNYDSFKPIIPPSSIGFFPESQKFFANAARAELNFFQFTYYALRIIRNFFNTRF